MAAKRTEGATVAALILGLLAATPAWSAPPQTLYYERVLMDAAGGRCDLFEPKVRASLLVGAAQARSAALAAGQPAGALDATAARARARADAVACASPELHIAAQRVRAAFLVWSHERDLVLPGRRGLWRAARGSSGWALVERSPFAAEPAALGLLPDGAARTRFDLAAAVPPNAAAGAYAARLVMRDPARAAEPYLSPSGEPPAQARQVFVASARGAVAPSLLAGGGAIYRFPAAATDALAALDPREEVRLELVHSAAHGERITSTLFEAGDFATGRAFLLAGN